MSALEVDVERWQDAAACAGKGAVFFSLEPHDIALAKAICVVRCPVRQACGEHAYTSREQGGVWAGVDLHDAYSIPEARRRLAEAGYGPERR